METLGGTVSRYSKAIAALAVAVVIAGFTAAQGVMGDGMSGEDWMTVLLAALAPIAVFFAPRNTDPEE